MGREVEGILDAPVFIVGAPRSGTTWVQRLLLSHPRVCGGQESNFFDLFGPISAHYREVQRAPRLIGLPCYRDFRDIRQEVVGIWRRTFSELVEKKPTATVLLEKTPRHALHIAEILDFLPRSRFIHVIRDSRSVVASLLAAGRDGWGAAWAPSSAREAAGLWWRFVTRAREGGRSLGPDYIEVHYEDLKRGPATQVARLLAFLGLTASGELVEEIVEQQDLGRQKEIGGTPFDMPARPGGPGPAEPAGFLRRGEIDGWRGELNLLQRLVVWRYTRRLMHQCGYSWAGRPAGVADSRNGRAAAAPIHHGPAIAAGAAGGREVGR